MSVFGKFREELSGKKTYSFNSSLSDRKSSGKEYKHVHNVWDIFLNERNERLSRFVFKIWRFIDTNCV